MRLLDFDEELLPPPRWLEWEIESELPIGFTNAQEQRTQSGGHRNREGAVLAAFWRWEGDFVLGKIKAFHGQPGFPQPAAGMQGDVKAYLHPLGLRFQGRSNLSDFFIGDFRLLGRLVTPQFEAD